MLAAASARRNFRHIPPHHRPLVTPTVSKGMTLPACRLPACKCMTPVWVGVSSPPNPSAAPGARLDNPTTACVRVRKIVEAASCWPDPHAGPPSNDEGHSRAPDHCRGGIARLGRGRGLHMRQGDKRRCRHVLCFKGDLLQGCWRTDKQRRCPVPATADRLQPGGHCDMQVSVWGGHNTMQRAFQQVTSPRPAPPNTHTPPQTHIHIQ